MWVRFSSLAYGDWFVCDDGAIGQKIDMDEDNKENYAIFFGDKVYNFCPQNMSYNPKVKKLDNVRLCFDEPIWVERLETKVVRVIEKDSREIRL